MKGKILRLGAGLLAAVLLLTCGTAVWLLATAYSGDEAAVAALADGGGVTVEESEDGLLFRPGSYDRGLIFYPGARVEPEAYSPLMHSLAEAGILVVLLEMPLNLAILEGSAAEGIPGEYPEVETWYIGGHSLGGYMAAGHAAEAEGYAGLLLLAAYTGTDLRESGLSVLSVRGSEDGILNGDRYEEGLALLPADTREVVLPGGNHSQFGSYGHQEGDGTPSITPREQIEATAAAVTAWMAGTP